MEGIFYTLLGGPQPDHVFSIATSHFLIQEVFYILSHGEVFHSPRWIRSFIRKVFRADLLS